MKHRAITHFTCDHCQVLATTPGSTPVRWTEVHTDGMCRHFCTRSCAVVWLLQSPELPAEKSE